MAKKKSVVPEYERLVDGFWWRDADSIVYAYTSRDNAPEGVVEITEDEYDTAITTSTQKERADTKREEFMTAFNAGLDTTRKAHHKARVDALIDAIPGLSRAKARLILDASED